METCEKTNVHFQWSFSESDNEERPAPIIQAVKKTPAAAGVSQLVGFPAHLVDKYQ